MKDLRWSYVFFLVVLFSCQFIPLVWGLFFEIPEDLFEMLYQYVFFLLPAVAYVLIRKRNLKEIFRLKPICLKSILLLIAITVVMQPFLGITAQIGVWIFGDNMDLIMGGFENTPLLMYIFMVAITPAICEEVLLRGVMLDAASQMSVKKAVIMNGFLFGIFHMNFNQFSYTVFMGMILAYVVLRTGSIYASMLMHLVNNGLSIFMEKANTDFLFPMETLTKQWGDPIGISICFVLAILSAYATLKLLKHLPKANSEVLLEEKSEGNVVVISGFGQYASVYWPVVISCGLFFISAMSIYL